MSDWKRTVSVDFLGGISVEIPESVVRKQETGVDSAAAVLEGGGITVVVDQGPFADTLRTHVGRPGYEEHTESIAGRSARTISYQLPEEGAYVVGVHLPDLNRLTVVVRAEESVPRDVVQHLLATIRDTTQDSHGN